MSFAKLLIEDIKKIVYNTDLDNNGPLIAEGLKRCTKASKLISNTLKHSPSIAEKQHLSTCLGQIKSFRGMLNAAKVVGFGYTTRKETATHRVKWEDLHSAFQSRIRTGVVVNLRHTDVMLFLNDCAALFRRRIQNALKKDEAVKVNAVLCGEFHISSADKILLEEKFINTRNAGIYKNTDLDNWFMENIQDPILTELEEFQERDSGWALCKIVNLVININKFNPLRVGTYVDLPPQIKRRQACINVQNDDEMCFAWAVVSALYPAPSKVADRTSSYPNPKEVLNLKGIQFPMTLRQVSRFEKQNNVSLNVYRLEKSKKNFNVIPAYLSKTKLDKHVNLLVIQDNYYCEDDDAFTPVKNHYVWIKSLSRLLLSQLSAYHKKKYICDCCLHYFHFEEKLAKHVKDCEKLNDGSVPRVPTVNKKWVEFKDFKFKETAPFAVYADTECLLIPVEDDSEKNTQNYQKHVPYSVGYYVKCAYDDSLSFYKSYTGKDCMQWFVKELFDFAANVETVFLCDLPMEPLTAEETRDFFHSQTCHVCEKPFTTEDKKVRDHCHLTGKYRGPAHENCNLNYQDSHTIPVFFHNMSCYDGHMVLKALTEVEGEIDVLPVNKERYISFTKHIPGNLIKFRFIDSFRFLASRLDKLSSYLTEYPILQSQFNDLNREQFSLLCRKGVFPYDFMSSWEKLNSKELPQKNQFYNSLTDTSITNEEYEHARTVWNTFECRTMQQYSDLYLKTDVLLLADVFEQFRKTSFKTYGIDPAHAFTLPGYAWQCMLYQMSKTSEIKLELLTDLDMVLFVEKGIRGGLSQCSKRFAEANNKYMPSYDPSKEESYLMYFDINNQYGWAMSQYLPYGNFKWLSEEEISAVNILNIPDDSDEGLILEVDLEIPQELHDLFSDLPPCPGHQAPNGSKNVKLLATLNNKTEYVIHYRNLKQALALGVKLIKIHRVLSFSHSPWLKKYIDLNTRLRQAAKNEFEKNLFKLMNNAVFGKTMENVRKHSSIKLVSKWDGRYGAEALISRPEFKNSVIINENFAIIELAKSEIYFNKPIYVGMCILDLAKTTIYDFHYNYMLRKFTNNCKVLYTDTDSLIYEIKNQDVYNVMKEDCREYFDTSDYPTNNLYNIPPVNKKVLGMMKDENNGRIMTHFIGLRSKMYATKLFFTSEELERERIRLEAAGKELDEIEKCLMNKGVTKKIKGVKKCVINNKITFDDYVECLETLAEKHISQNLIRSKKHELHTIKQTKIALSPHDDKRKISKISVDTLPWGHWSIMEED